jgi:FAD/FMN-containing dehydrogenase
MLHEGVELVCRVAGLPRPFPEAHAAHLLVEVADDVDRSDALAAVLGSVAGVADVAVATDPVRRRALWRYREAHTEAIGTVGTPHKLDTALPIPALAEFVARVPGAVRGVAPEATAWLFGHVAEGNVHVNVTGVAPDDDRVDDAVFRLVAELGGSISAEHGVGTAKLRWVPLTRTGDEVATWRALKAALDPGGILNPRVLFPAAAGSPSGGAA